LIAYTRRALRQIEDLREHYDGLGRYDATDAFEAALEEAERKIAADPAAGLPAPRPYPQLARPGRLWVKAGRYWIAYRPGPHPTITAAFFETANIPGRL
jgi:plasmid stabilization system protein ParE